MAVSVPILARICQFGLERTAASPVRSHLEIISYLLPVHRAAYVSLARRRRLCLKEKHPCPSGTTYVSSSTSSASSSALFAPEGSMEVSSRDCDSNTASPFCSPGEGAGGVASLLSG